MRIDCLDPQTDPRWQQLVEQQESDVFHSPEWMKVLADTYDFPIEAHVAIDHTETPQAGLPFSLIADSKGERIVSLPFSDYCDPLVNGSGHWEQLANRLLQHRCPVRIRCLHNTAPLNDRRFKLINKAKWHGLDLSPNVEDLWGGLKESGRRAVRKAGQHGIEVRVAQDKNDLRGFYDLHLRLRKNKYRLLAQPYRFFERIWHHLIENQKGILLVGVHADKIVSGILFLEWKDTLYYKFNASSPDYLQYRPNDLLLWEGIQYAKSKDYVRLDFGLSDWDQEGLLRYKRKYADEEKTISFLQCDPENSPIEKDNTLGKLLPQLTGLFTDESVPDEITEKAGDILYRYFT